MNVFFVQNSCTGEFAQMVARIGGAIDVEV